ncbi:MAG: tetratricopeptide repeat protein [Myxococcales bacterium]|nr:tetratricopeptide repeat protein [Myxococcales bacterium]
MRELFLAQGFVVRRCEATLAGIRALVDRGIPVVLEEAYSTTSHVTLAIGYDDDLELLLVQDPMQLGPRETPYEELDRLRGVFGHGALVVVPADDAARRAALDELGVVDSPSVLATEDGLRHLRAREWDAARACFERALELAPERELGAIGRLEAALGRLAADGSPADGLAAVTALVEAARTRVSGAEWPRQFSGRLALRAGRLAEARDDFRAAHERDPGDADNVWYLGQCAAAAGEHERAVELFHAALLRDPGHVEAHESLAAAYLDQKRRDRARHFVELALALDPDDARNHENQGLYHELAGRSGEALACFDRALARDPGNARAAVARGRCLVSLGRRGDADAAFARALELAPGNDRLRVQIGAVLFELDDVKGAWAVVSPALERATQVAPVCALAGACLFRLERPDEAEPLLRQALAEVPDYAFAAHELGRGLLAAGRFDRALALFEERRLREPDAPRHALDACDALLALGRKEEACRTATGVLERLGAFPELVRRVAKLLHDAGRFADGRHAFEEPIERALDQGKIDRPLVRAYGAFLAAVGDERAAYVWTRIETGYGLLGRPEALALFEELRASEPGDLRHEENCILALEAMGQPEQALERSLRLLEATGWKSPRLLRRHYQLGWRNGLHKGGTGKVWEQALERNPDDLAIIEGLVQHQADMGFGDSHYAVWWKKKLEELRRTKAGVEGGGAV